MPDNPFDELLRDFQRAYAEYGEEVFFLCALTGEEWNNDRPAIDEMAGCLGFVPLGEEAPGEVPGYYIFGPLHRHRFGQWTERWQEPFKCFERLAARAGASLPLAVRSQIPFPPAGPVAWWLACMWWQQPPSDKDLLLPDGMAKETRVIWAAPFLESAEAIECGQLNTSQPAVPATTEGGTLVEMMTGRQFQPGGDTRKGSSKPPRASNEMTLTEAAEKWDVPKPAWSKGAKREPGEPGYLQTRKLGRNRLVRRDHADRFAKDYLARREQRTVGSKTPEGAKIVSALRETQKRGKRRH